jgi:hypothetical protein
MKGGACMNLPYPMSYNNYDWGELLYNSIQEHRYVLRLLNKSKPHEIIKRAAYLSKAKELKQTINRCIRMLDFKVGFLGILSLYEYMESTTNSPRDTWQLEKELGPYLKDIYVEAGV